MKESLTQKLFQDEVDNIPLVRLQSTEASLSTSKGRFIVISYGHFIFVGTVCILLSVAELAHYHFNYTFQEMHLKSSGFSIY